ncbi:hypothetical protein A2W14_01385 [Candidatus Gottesmanbacteria bacterium RBG_16_37_8]|uniref:Uncharacterized protein n=1 Tax=Candidatus Gottesmanbacteria bacterium RBG_16_37_8 TaxID=1798371 RepID=A0A1F5YU29_9BACT|nr:MAG: hypothetical protein A2W14_01385 [Candidatus Gottesmanbacteria bacterium RBG_16_37_8]
MDDTQISVYQLIKNFIQTSNSLEEQEKIKFLLFLDQLAAGKYEDVETAEAIAQYLDQELPLLEEAAIAAKDTEQINLLADLRNARLELQKQLLGITTTP